MQRQEFSALSPGKIVVTGDHSIAFVPNRLPPEWGPNAELQQLHESAVLSLGELRAIVPSLPNPSLVTSPFLHREAVLSSRIEGTRTEIDQLYLFEAKEPASRRGESADSQDAREVLNYVHAMQFGLQKLSELPICHRLIKEMHRILLEGIRGQVSTPGEYRRCQNFIGASRDIRTARFVPPPPEEMAAAMDDLERYIHRGSEYPSLLRIALVHYQFEAIHPFEDGNGRIGRLLITLLLSAYGLLPDPLLYLSDFFERNRSEYYNCLLQVSRQGAWADWVGFFLKGVTTEASDAIRRARKLMELREFWRNKLQHQGASASLLTLVDALFQSPAISVSQAQVALSMTYRGAKRNIDRLEADGLLTEMTGQQRNKVYLARPIADVLSAERIDEIT